MSPPLALSTAADSAEPTGPHLRSVPQPWHLGDTRRAVAIALLSLALAALPPAVDDDPPAPAPPLRPRPEA